MVGQYLYSSLNNKFNIIVVLKIEREYTNIDVTDFVVTEYQFSGISGSNPLSLA
jgi:hypothetical protein